MKGRLSAIIFLFVIGAFLPVLPIYNRASAIGPWAHANDFSMNFDNFQVGTANPFPFTHSGSCSLACQIIYFGIVGCNTWCSAPNIYELGTSTHITLSATFNATNTKVVATVQSNCLTGYAATATATFKLNDSVMSNATTVTSAASHCQASGNSVLYNATVSALPGNPVMANFTFSTTTASNTAIYIDNFQITYGSVEIPSYNFELYNASSAGPYWFDPSQYTGSQLVLNYSSGASNSSAHWANACPCGLQYSDVKYANLNTANLITLYVGNIYSRTLIPQPETSLAMYVDNPQSVQQFTAQVLAPPGYYGVGTIIEIQTGGYNVTTGYLDSTSKFSTYLVPGLYRVIVNDGKHSTSQLVTFPSSTNNVQINAYATSTPANANGVSSVRWFAAWNTTHTGVVIQYWDNLSSTFKLGVQINLLNGSGSFQLYSNKFTTTGDSFFSSVIPANTCPLCKNNSASLFVAVSINSTVFGGNFSLGSLPLASCNGCFTPQTPTLSTSIGGLNAIFPTFTWQNAFGDLIIIAVAGIFGLFQSKIGAVFMPVVAGFLVLLGWLPANLSSIIIMLVAFGILGAMSWWRRQP